MTPTLRSPVRWHPVLFVGYFGFAAASFASSQLAPGGAASRVQLALGLAVIVLYGTLSILLSARGAVAVEQARVFSLLAVLVTGTVALAPLAYGAGPPGLDAALTLARTLVFFVCPAAVVHMAALIPARHMSVRRHRWLAGALYGITAAMGAAAACLQIAAAASRDGWAQPLQGAVVTANNALIVLAGLAALLLLGDAARREPSSPGRRQALLVFCGVLPWTIVQTLRLLLPHDVAGSAVLGLIEIIVILVVPMAMFIAIIGFRMFELELLVRRSLIYGLTLALPFAGLAAVWLAAGVLAGRTLGLAEEPLGVGVVLLAVGVALRPVGRWVRRQVDRVFFPEKEALRRLPRTMIGDLAALTDLESAAEGLVRRLQREMGLRSCALLVADDERRFFRIRAAAWDEAAGEGAPEGVVPVEDLAAIPNLLAGRPATGLAAVRGSARMVPAALATLGVDTLLPVSSAGVVSLLVCLGAPLAGGSLDREDVEQLEVLAEQVAAVMEHARVNEFSRLDPLTRLARRHVAIERLGNELKRGRRTRSTTAVALADVDNFKGINDRHGHLVGDRALQAVAAALQGRARRGDLIARYGGEEFVALLPETAVEGAVTVCEAMLSAVRKAQLAGTSGEAVSVTISIGLAVACPGETAEDVVRRADQALYQAKAQGKNRVVLAPPPGSPDAMRVPVRQADPSDAE